MNIDWEAYANRVGYHGAISATLETLRSLHLAHATHIPFENLDPLLGQPVRLDLESLWRKLVQGGRGGYCFEHNTLFAAVLEAVGFNVVRLAGRVRMGAPVVRPRTHMLLLVDAGGERWLSDVGFGADGILFPVPFRPGEEVAHFAWKHRIITEAGQYVLQCLRPERWLDMYAFTLEPQYPVDYEVGNHFTSTHPDSPFRRTLIVQRPGPDVRLLLMNRRLLERKPDGVSETELPDEDAILKVLARQFGLHLPAGTRFPLEESALSVLATR